MAGRHPQAGPSKPLRAQKGQKQPRAAVAVRGPPSEEEDPRVKCKNCGAFGHKATSTRCPMKHWDGAVAPQPLSSNKMKENRKLCSPGDARNPGSTALPAKEKEQRPSQEDQQRQALLQRYPRRPLGRLQPSRKDQEQICNYLRHPHQPMPVHTTQRICLGDIGHTTSSPDRNPDEISTVSAIHRAERSIFSPTVAQAKHPDVKSPSMGQAAAHSSGHNSQVSLKAPGKRAAESPVQTSQNPLKKPRLSSCPAPQKTMPRADPEGKASPLRMVLRRLKGGQWSSRLLSTPSVLPAEGPAPPAQSPPSPGMAEAPYASESSSALYEDLQVSSSSEDSEDLQDFSFWEDTDD
ncbi:LOW QUALITY PROTEIN: putative protein FAM90A16P/FAM90A17P [Phyllostomus hastatus]|uniref:LOW QUALITY PROTEIN: putative protein FAM90A16P/FAM90A17P n=1 Tax=Phyllostomus hastatus TaxID=9423 RepID=UPI001E68083A|nr:LOW QUALITY PROTEIN: putative protein FAM90A16P/FAM90A17P [Phyllostomus hastatus]